MPESLAFNLNFLHPLAMWALLALSGYAMFLGIKAKKTRTADAETRKTLIKGQFAKRHYLFGSAVFSAHELAGDDRLRGLVERARTKVAGTSARRA